MNTRTILRQVRLVFSFLLVACLSSLAQTAKPLTYTGLVDALRMHGLTDAELAQIVKTRGVDFQLTPEKSSELKAAGADAPLLSAIASAYRGTATPVTPTKSQPQPQTQASPTTQATVKSVAVVPATVASPQPAAANPPISPARPAVSSLRQVKNLYIERMSNNLDEYLKAELSRQIPGRFVLVLRPQDADGIMKGRSAYRDATISITDPRGTVVLWSGQAGGSGVLHTGLRGGEKEIAKHLVGSLRKAME